MVKKIDELKNIAAERGGKCLSESYTDRRTKLLWECAERHVWEATPERIKAGGWCNECKGLVKTSITDLHNVASERGGKCLSNEYTNPKAQYQWQCAEDHTWQSSWNSIKYGKTWCPECGKWQSGRTRRKYTIEHLKEYAQKKGGDCLATEYKGTGKRYQWVCANGHKWKAQWNNVVTSNNWCPICASHTGERICRAFFEQLFREEFLSIKPKWLRSEKGFRMELDGYCEKLGIAFEHQGTQHLVNRKHFKDSDFFGVKPSKFEAIQQRDALKMKQCRENGILLIQVPSILEVLKLENVKSFIREELLKNNYPLPQDFDSIVVNPDMAYNFNKLEELQEIATSRGGKLLSKEYFDTKTNYLWECVNGHTWQAKADNIKQGKWCKTCAGLDRKTIEDMQCLASKREGQCLSTTYNGSQSSLLWQCKHNHQWEAIPNNIARGSWCPTCRDIANGVRKRKYSLEDLKAYAHQKKGSCISKAYTITHAEYYWMCDQEHEFIMSFDKVKQGYWCPYCAGNAKKTIADLQRAATARGGKCLSPEYTNIKAKYSWECKKRHVWLASADSVLRGSWCRTCYNEDKKMIPYSPEAQQYS